MCGPCRAVFRCNAVGRVAVHVRVGCGEGCQEHVMQWCAWCVGARAVFGCEQQAVWEWRGVDVVVGVEVVLVDVAVAVGGVDGGDGVVAPLPPPLLLPPSPSSLRGCQLVCSVHVEMLVLGRV